MIGIQFFKNILEFFLKANGNGHLLLLGHVDIAYFEMKTLLFTQNQKPIIDVWSSLVLNGELPH